MMIQKLTTGACAIALLTGLGGRVLVYGAGQQGRGSDRGAQYGGALDAKQHGYEHAYRDGADRGRQDRESGRGYDLRDTDYQSGAREYEPAFGDRTQYMNGYRDGFKAGYDDAFNDRPGRYGEIYGRPSGGSRGGQAPAGNDTYASNKWSSEHAAFDVGYRDGVSAGQGDQRRNVRSNFRSSTEYQNADLGYRSGYGDRESYRTQFRDGFERGYQDGYGRSQYSSDGGGYFPPQGRTGPADTRDGQGTPERTITVPANRQWTPTSIRVTQGETVRLQVTGEIRYSSNPNDRAISAGSLSHGLVPGAPLPAALAGALIGRIDNGRPFGIGNLPTLVMPASGLLYLGVNDDNLGDNSGQFQVVISW